MTEWTMPDYKEFDTLPNAKQLTEAEVARSHLGMYTPHRVLCMQVPVPDTKANCNIIHVRKGRKAYALAKVLVLHDGRAWAFYCDYHGQRVLWWQGGACMHEHKTRRTVGKCLNEYRCEDCGYTETIDSSD